MSDVSFADLGLAEPLLRALDAAKYTVPTPIQAHHSPPAAGPRLLGCAQTGTGKTAAFALPILQRLAAPPRARAAPGPRALVLTPTRELAAQIGRQLRHLRRGLGLRLGIVFGGVGQRPPDRGAPPRRRHPRRHAGPPARPDGAGPRQARQCRVLRARRGRPHARHGLHPRRPPHHRGAAAAAPDPAVLGHHAAATSPSWLSEILNESRARSTSRRRASTAETIDQRVLLRRTRRQARAAERPAARSDDERVLVFTRTKHGANRVAEAAGADRRRAEAIHGNKSQSARQRALDDVQARQRPRAGRDRHRRARHRRRRRSPTSSTSTCRTSRRATSTASAAPRAPARRASRCRSATARSAASSRASSA